jgi:hypothetical protein
MLLIVTREYRLEEDYRALDSDSSNSSYSENGEVRLEEREY